MPVMDVFTAIRTLKETPETRDIKVIAMTLLRHGRRQGEDHIGRVQRLHIKADKHEKTAGDSEKVHRRIRKRDE